MTCPKCNSRDFKKGRELLPPIVVSKGIKYYPVYVDKNMSFRVFADIEVYESFYCSKCGEQIGRYG